MKKKICIVVNSRANYARIKSVMRAIKEHNALELQLIVGASALLYRFGEAAKIIRKDGFIPNAVVHSIVEGETPTTMAKSTGLAIVELATHFENLKPDIVLTVADRFETLATAVAASYMNIPLAHTQGGEVTGSIDESVRHAITKLAHIHFPATKRAREFVIRMGENPKNVFLVGCPAIDLLNETNLTLPKNIFSKYGGVGMTLDPKRPYILVLQHPVTTEYGSGFAQINETLVAIENIKNKSIQIVWLWPNVDAGSDDISKGLRIYRERKKPQNIHFFRNFSPEDYARVLNNCKCIIGNSSSGLREGGFLGIPCVNIGSRQSGRERSKNVLDVDYDWHKISKGINIQLSKKRFKKSLILGNGTAGNKIADILASKTFSVKKTLNYLNT